LPLLLFSRNHRATNKRRCSPPVVILVISARTSLSPASSSRRRNYASASVSVITLPDPAPIADGLPMTQRSPLVRFAARCDPMFALSRPGAAQRLAIVWTCLPRKSFVGSRMSSTRKLTSWIFVQAPRTVWMVAPTDPATRLGGGTLRVGEPCAS
jgi:hypothetical protein